jgi:hypothetical protein
MVVVVVLWFNHGLRINFKKSFIFCLQLTVVDSSAWINVHIYSSKSVKSFRFLQINNTNIRQPYFIQEMFSDLQSFGGIPGQSIVVPSLSDEDDHFCFLEAKNS